MRNYGLGCEPRGSFKTFFGSEKYFDFERVSPR